jgi:hypothetical protein
MSIRFQRDTRLRRFAVLSVVLLVWGAVAEAGPKLTRYVDAAYHFSFQPPAGWKRVTTGVTQMTVAFAGPASNGFATNVNIVVEPVGKLTLDDYVKATKKAIAKQKGMTIDGEKPAKLGGEPGHSWRMHLRMPNMSAVDNRQVLCVHNKRGFVVTFSTLPSELKKQEATFDKLLASFKWEK